MSKLEINKKEKKDALLKTAFDLFMSKGINKTSISDIANNAGVAKGTFYLYFKDKYDIRNHLIANKADALFFSAYESLLVSGITDFYDQFIFMVDYIIDQLDKDRSLLMFISKQLSWAVFKNVLIHSSETADGGVYSFYEKMLENSGYKFDNPEIMIYMIIELVSGTSYSAILYSQPVSIEELKPHVYATIRNIITSHIVSEEDSSDT